MTRTYPFPFVFSVLLYLFAKLGDRCPNAFSAVEELAELELKLLIDAAGEGDEGFGRRPSDRRLDVVDLADSSFSAARLLRKRWARTFSCPIDSCVVANADKAAPIAPSAATTIHGVRHARHAACGDTKRGYPASEHCPTQPPTCSLLMAQPSIAEGGELMIQEVGVDNPEGHEAGLRIQPYGPCSQTIKILTTRIFRARPALQPASREIAGIQFIETRRRKAADHQTDDTQDEQGRWARLPQQRQSLFFLEPRLEQTDCQDERTDDGGDQHRYVELSRNAVEPALRFIGPSALVSIVGGNAREFG